MAPSGRTKTTTARGRKPRRRSHFKKKQSHCKKKQSHCKKKQSQKHEISTDFNASGIDPEAVEVFPCSACLTPKGQKFRIPEVLTCPPAPKKKPQLLSNNSCSLRRSTLALFATPLDVRAKCYLFSADIYNV